MRYPNLKSKKLAVIGLGNMGTALLGGVISSRLLPARDIRGCDLAAGQRRKAAKSFKIRTCADAADAASADIVVIAVKPQGFEALAATISGKLPARSLVISIMAGVPSASISKKLGGGLRVVRAMPNTPALLGEGMTAVCRGGKATAADIRTATAIFDAVGRTLEVKEKQMDLVTGLSGSGPAYFFLLLEALATSGVKQGLKRRIASLLAAQTALGAARMVLETGKEPASLRAKVTSKGGTTQAGLEVLAQAGFKRIIHNTVKAATRRAGQLGRKSK